MKIDSKKAKKIGAVMMLVGGAGLLAHAAYTKNKQRKYTQIIGEPEEKDEKDISQRIKEAAAEKAAKIVTFVVENQDKIEAATTVIGIAGTVIGVVNGIKEYKRGDEMEDMLKDICAFNDEFADQWNGYCKCMDSLDNDLCDRLDRIEKAVTKKKK